MIMTCFSPSLAFAKQNPRGEEGGNQSIAEQNYGEEDFHVSGNTFNGLTEKGKLKLKANKGALEFSSLKSQNGTEVSRIGNSAFKELGITSVKFSSDIESIGNNAFYKNDIEKLILPDSITDINYGAFSNNKISELKLSENCSILYPSVFGNNKIKEVDIPDGVGEIRVNAFENNPGDPEHDNKVVLFVSDKDKINFYNDTPETYFIKEKNSENYVAKDFTYNEKSQYGKDFVEITGLSDSGKEKQKKNHQLNIPSTIHGKEVRSIEKEAFENKNLNKDKQFTSVVLPKKMKSIGENAFIGNALTKVELPSTLEEVGPYAFAYNELTQVLIPESVKSIAQGAFANNKIKQGDARIDNIKGKVTVGFEAFGDITPVYLKTAPKHSVKIDAPKGVNVSLSPESPVEEGAKVKINCEVTDSDKEILYVKVKKGKYSEVKVTDNTFTMPNGDVTVVVRLKDKYSKDKWCIEDFTYHRYEVGDMEDENYINEMTVNGFSDKGKEKLKNNKEVVLPEMNLKGEEVESVYENAFEDKGITKLTVPKNYKKIYDKAFKNNKIKELILNEGLVYIFDETFANNEITEFVAPKSFKYASKAAFKGNKIKKVKLTDSVESIGPESFMDNEISELDVANKVRLIYGKAFVNNKLTEVNIPKSLKKQGYGSLEPIAKDAFDGNPGKINPLKPGENKVLLWTPNKDNPNKLPNGNNYVVDPVVENNEYLPEDFSFSDGKVDGFSSKGEVKYKKLSADVPVPLPAKDTKGKEVTGIAEYAFDGVTPAIKKIDIPKGYKTIGQMAFNESEIEKVKLPDTIEEVDELAFFNNSNIEIKLHVSSKTIADKIGNPGNCWTAIIDESPVTPTPSDKWTTEDFKFGTMKVKVLENGVEQEVELNAVTGFSDKGLEKVKIVKDLELPKVDDKNKPVEAVNNGAFSANFGEKRLDTLKIPEGYKVIGSMAFAFNGCGGDLVLPDSMEFVDSAAFFRNEFTSLTVPAKMTDISLSMMRGNKLKNVIFKGNIESIGRLAFAENQIEDIRVPDSLKEIGVQAFTTNTGLDDYDGKVVIRTASGKNPNNLQDKENYLIDPPAPTPGPNPPINYNEWNKDDFEYDGTTVKGFSDQGRKKIRKNKKLVIPDKTPDGKDVEIIGMDAFRNLNQGFDIESVKIPDTVTEIEDYALQFNDIKEVKLPRDLKKLGMGVFMMSNVEKVEWNDKLEYIDQACFYNSTLGKIKLPASLKTIMNASFRKSGLTEVTFAEGSKLQSVEALAFADNKLSNIDLPTEIEKIGNQVFANNKFTELNVPGTLKEIGHQAFLNNPGVEKYKAVVIHTPEGKNPNNLVDDPGNTFVIDPENVASEQDKAPLKDSIKKAEKVNIKKLTAEFKNFFEETLNAGKEALNDKKATKSRVESCIKSLNWAVKRAEISALMFKKEELDPKAATFDKKKWNAVEEAYKSAKKYLMVINISDIKVEKIIKDLDVALKDLTNESILEGAKAYEGEFDIKKTHYVKPYTVKVKVWVKDGKIVYVRDNGTVCDDPKEEEEPNKGYYEHANEILNLYIGKDVNSVLKNPLGKDLGIDSVSGATISCNALHEAIKDALKKIDNSNVKPSPKPDNPDEKSDLAKIKLKLKKINIKVKSYKIYKKSIKLSWKKAAIANRYKVAYKKNKAKRWSYKMVKKNQIKITKLSKKSRIAIKIAPVKVIGKKTVMGKYSKVNYYHMSNVKIKKLIAEKKKIRVILKKFTGITGYQIAYSQKASLKNARYKTVRKNKIALRGLKAKKKYYVKVRSYKKIAGKKYFGGWSKIKTIKVK